MIYYVKTNGNDVNDGLTIATAWQHPSYAAQQAKAGDTIYLLDGTWYGEHITFANSGTAGNPIVMKAYSGKPTLDGLGVGNGINIINKAYITLDGLTIKNYGTGGLYNCINGMNTSFITVTNNTVSDTAYMIHFEDADNLTISSNDISRCNFKNSIHITSYKRPSTDILISNNYFHDHQYADGDEIDMFLAGTSPETSHFDRFTIEGNIIIGGLANEGIYQHVYGGTGGFRNVKIRNNIFYNIGKAAVDAHLFSGNSVIENNVFYGNAFAAIRIIYNTNVTIKNNIITNNGRGIWRTVGTVALAYNDVWGNTENYVGISKDATDISVDPLFANPANKDFHLKSQYGRWNPVTSSWVTDSVTSPAIDAGDPTSDYLNEPSPNGGRINMGAYGNTPEASKSPGAVLTGTISGTVTDTSNNTIQGATVSDGTRSATTDINGNYTIPNIPEGIYIVTASKTGYQSSSQSNVAVTKDQITIVNFVLTPVPPDTTPPSAVTNLAASNPASNSIKLTWTAPGDDGNTGTASQYDIRYSTSPITDSNWNSATQVSGEPTPLVAGSSETFTVTGLSPDTTYYFALKTADEVPNWSAISNSPSGTTSSDPQPGDVIIWDTNQHYTGNQFPMGEAFANKASWTQVPYGTTNYTFNGDAMIENEYFYLFLFSSTLDAVGVYAKYDGGNYGVQQGAELYKVYDTGERDFGMGTLYTKIQQNTPEEIIVEHAGIGANSGQPVVTTYHIPKKPWIEVRPVSRANQQGMHMKSRLANFLFQNINDDIILDGLKHGNFEENVYPSAGSIGEINFHRMRSSSYYDDQDFMYFLTFPPGTETNSLTYQGIHYPDPFWEDVSDTPCIGANYAYLGEKVVVGVLNFRDNWKREDVNQSITTGQTYTSIFTAPYAGKWRITGVFSDDDWNITDYFSEINVNTGDHFTFTSPRSGTLEYLVMYMFDRTADTPFNIITPMDVHKEISCSQVICILNIT